MSKDQAIAPCPFCGHAGLTFAEGSTFRWLAAECERCCATCGETRIQTLGEGTPDKWMAQAKQDAIEVWNTRAAQPDCRTCENYRPSWDMTCAKAICIKGSKYIEAPRVVLWRKE